MVQVKHVNLDKPFHFPSLFLRPTAGDSWRQYSLATEKGIRDKDKEMFWRWNWYSEETVLIGK